MLKVTFTYVIISLSVISLVALPNQKIQNPSVTPIKKTQVMTNMANYSNFLSIPSESSINPYIKLTILKHIQHALNGIEKLIVKGKAFSKCITFN